MQQRLPRSKNRTEHVHHVARFGVGREDFGGCGLGPCHQLGKESDVVQQVKVGSIDMMLTGSSIWATVTPQLGMLDLGYLFDSY